MRPRLVFVHGIGGPRRTDRELAEWTRSLASGMAAAGHSGQARRLEDGDVEGPVFAYYGDLFHRPQAQGGAAGPVPAGEEEEAAVLGELLLELTDALLADNRERASDDEEWRSRHKVLEHARAEAAPNGQEQGALSVARRALNVATTLLSLPPWRGAAQWMLPKLMVRDLAQVARYLARAEPDEAGATLDRRIRQRLAEAIGQGPTVVVAHSLGTVVALETLHESSTVPVPLFVTLGSPLSLRAVVQPRTVPRPTATPESVVSWLNFWDRDDLISVRPLLERDVRPNRFGVVPVSSRVDSDGIWVHSATKYLAHPAVAGPIAEALARAASGERG
ncbi:hypothetical protein ACFT5C_19535 [Streptomyces sp. NPDC057116]|uniref:hypothetical protein n=1 Tax=Streptomyces sp. NPDC057116 TaxID=3346023 RepID=UPI003645EEE6